MDRKDDWQGETMVEVLEPETINPQSRLRDEERFFLGYTHDILDTHRS